MAVCLVPPVDCIALHCIGLTRSAFDREFELELELELELGFTLLTPSDATGEFLSCNVTFLAFHLIFTSNESLLM